jgi:hypothetical protein
MINIWSDKETSKDLLGYSVHYDLLKDVLQNIIFFII